MAEIIHEKQSVFLEKPATRSNRSRCGTPAHVRSHNGATDAFCIFDRLFDRA